MKSIAVASAAACVVALRLECPDVRREVGCLGSWSDEGLVGGAPLRIEADQPVVVEGMLVGPEGRLSLVPGIPVIER